jgi:guanosine-3',5'-bis(diphosphate) 3'-pyrophosphohydrolase
MNDIAMVLKALEFAAHRHKSQTRKGEGKTPFINHPIQVASLLANEAEEHDQVLITAAIMHDVIEDTVETEREKQELKDEIGRIFGEEVLSLIMEVTDDRNLKKRERKRLQVEHSSSLSDRAKKLKLADKIMNVSDVTTNPPIWWTLKRIREYLAWSEKVVDGMRGVNPRLEEIFDQKVKAGKMKYYRQ